MSSPVPLARSPIAFSSTSLRLPAMYTRAPLMASPCAIMSPLPTGQLRDGHARRGRDVHARAAASDERNAVAHVVQRLSAQVAKAARGGIHDGRGIGERAAICRTAPGVAKTSVD